MKYYTTTPIYYVNDKPHLGTAYATCMTEVMNLFRSLIGFETKFLTGTDEHGQKVQQVAHQRQVDPLTHCNEFSKNFMETWKHLNIDYDIFYRTTRIQHKKAVQSILTKLYDQGDIYEQNYEGWYCVGDETFYPEEDLKEGLSPTGKPVEKISEKNYFFRMSKYQQPLIDHIQKNPRFIQPKNRKKEVLSFLSQPLEDLSISRPKSRIHWGIPLPFDDSHVTYVWVDALSNYAIAVGFQWEEALFEEWWTQAQVQHIVGKDILIIHAVYWPTLLLALNTKLPDEIFGHGWILNKDSKKMSKSKGDTLNPLAVVDRVGIENFKYFITSEIRFGNDAPFSEELVIQKVNADLSNTLGNLLSRSTNLIAKFYDGQLPPGSPEKNILKTTGLELFKKVKDSILINEPHTACSHIISFLKAMNQYVEEYAPWKLVKEDKTQAGVVLRDTLEGLRISAILLSPVLKIKSSQLLEALNFSWDKSTTPAEKVCSEWYLLNETQVIQKAQPLFPRL